MASANWTSSYDTAIQQLNDYKSQLEALGADTSEVDKRIADVNQQKQTNAITGQKGAYKGDNSDLNQQIENLKNEKATNERESANDAATAAQNESNQIADTSKIAARNEGLNKSASALLSGQDASTNYARGYSTANQTMANQNAMTQADWLAKQGDVQGLQQTATNIGNSAGTAALGAFFQGLSDERAKEAPSYEEQSFEDRLLTAVDDYLKLVQKASAKKRGSK